MVGKGTKEVRRRKATEEIETPHGRILTGPGGAERKITNLPCCRPSVSPNGQWIACVARGYAFGNSAVFSGGHRHEPQRLRRATSALRLSVSRRLGARGTGDKKPLVFPPRAMMAAIEKKNPKPSKIGEEDA